MPLHTKSTHTTVAAALTPLLAALAFAACSELPTATPDEQSPANAPPLAAATAEVNLAGRALAANCFQCHGTDGVAGELKIAGESASGIIAELTEMRGKNPRDNIMNLHALAYTPAEIALIADYISRQGH